MQQPTIEEWQSLYEAANEFKAAKPWKWMDDSDIFGVQDPDTGTVYYCSIMGSGGTHFGIVAYRGTAGLIALENMMDSDGDFEKSMDLFYQNDCLECSFEDRDIMEKEELAVIRKLGLKYRGRNQWPSFRNHSPGFVPWFLDSSQCKILTGILPQVLEVAWRYRQNDIRLADKQGRFLVRCRKTDATGQAVWQDSYLEPAEYGVIVNKYEITDELLAQKLQKMKIEKGLEFEMEIFYSPAPVDGDERPYFPKLCAIMERDSGMLVACEFAKNNEDAGYDFLGMLTELLITLNKKPGRIYVARQETFDVFAAFCEKVKIKMVLTDSLPALTEFRLGMLQSLER